MVFPNKHVSIHRIVLIQTARHRKEFGERTVSIGRASQELLDFEHTVRVDSSSLPCSY